MSIPLPSADPSDLANAARCYSSCIPIGALMPVRTLELANITSVATNPTCTAPSAPTGVSASNARVADPTTQMNVRWNQPANSGSFITGYVIKWGTVSGVYTNSMNVPLTPHNFTVTGLTPGTTYFFVVQAFAFAGCISANSNEASNSTNAGGGPSGSCGAGNTFATAWAARVVANGGVAPSIATQTAIANFQCGLITDGLDTSMITWNAFVPDNLIATITPQLSGVGLDPWTNHNFVLADLTINGLKGDGATKWLDSGIDPSISLPMNNTGLTFYNLTNSNTINMTNLGCSQGVANRYINLENFGGSTFFFCFDAVSSFPSAANAGFTGYVSGNRINANSASIFIANSGTPHALLAFNAAANAGNPPVAFRVSVFCFNDNTGTLQFTDERMSFVAMHNGLTQAQSLLFFNRIQTLRTALGGGFI